MTIQGKGTVTITLDKQINGKVTKGKLPNFLQLLRCFVTLVVFYLLSGNILSLKTLPVYIFCHFQCLGRHTDGRWKEC